MLENFCIEHSGAFCEFPCSFRAGAAGLPGASPCHEYPYGCWHRESWHILAATLEGSHRRSRSLSLSLNVWALLVSVSLLLEKATCICLFVGLLLVFVSYLNPCSNSSLGQASLRIWSLLGLKGTATKAEIKSKPWDPAVWFLYVVSTHCQTDRLKHVDNLLICIDIMFLYTV